MNWHNQKNNFKMFKIYTMYKNEKYKFVKIYKNHYYDISQKEQFTQILKDSIKTIQKSKIACRKFVHNVLI